MRRQYQIHRRAHQHCFYVIMQFNELNATVMDDCRLIRDSLYANRAIYFQVTIISSSTPSLSLYWGGLISIRDSTHPPFQRKVQVHICRAGPQLEEVSAVCLSFLNPSSFPCACLALMCTIKKIRNTRDDALSVSSLSGPRNGFWQVDTWLTAAASLCHTLHSEALNL